MAYIEFGDVVRSYGEGSAQINALDGASFEVEKGELAVILGQSGAGKTTALNILGGMDRATSGRVVVGGRDISDASEAELVDFRRGDVGFVFQFYNLVPNLTALENVELAAQICPDSLDAEETLGKVGLADRLENFPAQLSGGQQQRVALARMLAARPGILMLDEPFSALDAHLKSVLEQNLVSLFDAFDGTILYVSHDIDEALRFCDRIAVVEDGHVIEIGTGDDLVNNPQSQAGIKLSGCKNATRAEYVDEHHVRLPRWGITVETSREVPRDVKCLGVRAFYLERADGPGENIYRVRVDRVSDSRFERTVLLGFVDACRDEREILDRNEDEMKYLHQHMFWRVDKLRADEASLPNEGEELWIRIPKDRVYLVSR